MGCHEISTELSGLDGVLRVYFLVLKKEFVEVVDRKHGNPISQNLQPTMSFFMGCSMICLLWLEPKG